MLKEKKEGIHNKDPAYKQVLAFSYICTNLRFMDIKNNILETIVKSPLITLVAGID